MGAQIWISRVTMIKIGTVITTHGMITTTVMEMMNQQLVVIKVVIRTVSALAVKLYKKETRNRKRLGTRMIIVWIVIIVKKMGRKGKEKLRSKEGLLSMELKLKKINQITV